MRVVIEGFDLPGRVSCNTEGEFLEDVHVGVQVRKDPHDLFPGDAPATRWEIEVELRPGPDGVDFFGPAVQGRKGDRFLYLTWGNVTDGDFEMFRREVDAASHRPRIGGAGRQQRRGAGGASLAHRRDGWSPMREGRPARYRMVRRRLTWCDVSGRAVASGSFSSAREIG